MSLLNISISRLSRPTATLGGGLRRSRVRARHGRGACDVEERVVYATVSTEGHGTTELPDQLVEVRSLRG